MRTKKAVYNIIANLVVQSVTAASGFILPALIIRYYGSEINGMIGSIKQFIAYLSVFEAGVGTASIAALYIPLVQHNNSAINSILAATREFYKKSGYFFLACLVLVAVIYPLLVRNEKAAITSFYMVVIIGFGGLMEYLLIGKYRVLLTADQKNYIISSIQAGATALNTLISIFLILKGMNVLMVQAVATLIYLSRFFLIRYYVNKYYSYVTFQSKPDFKAIHKRWSAFIHQVAAIIVYNSPVIIITIFCGLKDVSIYVVYNMVFSAVCMIVGVFSNGLLAGFGQIIADNEHEILSRLYANFEYVFYAVMAWAYTCAALLIMPFMNLYTVSFRDANYIRPEMAMLFLVIGVANNIRVPSNTLVNAAGHFQETQSRAILEAAINLSASLIFVQYWGIVGVLMGSVCSYAYRTLDFILYTAKYIIKQPPLRTIKLIIINAALAIISFLPFLLWIDIKATSYLQWLIWAMGIAIFVFIVVVSGNALTDLKMFKATLGRMRKLV